MKSRKEKKIAALVFLFFVLLFISIDLILGNVLIRRSYTEFRVRDSWFHHGLRKNVSASAAWGPIIYPFYTNSLGFRDLSVRNIPLQSDQRRILILGDSHSEGVGVSYNRSFAGLVQQRAAEHGIEVLNGSAVSYSPRIHYLKADYLINKVGLEVDEIWVIIDISDLQNEIAYASFMPTDEGIIVRLRMWLNDFLKKNSFSFHSFWMIKENREYEAFKSILIGSDDGLSQLPTRNSVELYREFFTHFDDQVLLRDPGFHGVSEWLYEDSLRELAELGMDLGMAQVGQLKNICDDHGISLKLSVHPWQTQILKGDTSNFYVEGWRKYCQGNGIEFMNFFPLFITEENRLWVARTCYIEGDNHWNEFGHERVANYLYQFVE